MTPERAPAQMPRTPRGSPRTARQEKSKLALDSEAPLEVERRRDVVVVNLLHSGVLFIVDEHLGSKSRCCSEEDNSKQREETIPGSSSNSPTFQRDPGSRESEMK
jgi:hypothetical protein